MGVFPEIAPLNIMRLGSPQSAGCVLMRNLDLVELFEEVRIGDQVWISD